jgi:hypothetical protein
MGILQQYRFANSFVCGNYCYSGETIEMNYGCARTRLGAGDVGRNSFRSTTSSGGDGKLLYTCTIRR